MAQIIDLCSSMPGVVDRFNKRQQFVLAQIQNCRTEYMGVNMYQCTNSACRHAEYRYASCKNRNCSVCSWLPREKWKMQRSNDMIPDTAYYHDVFTIPYEFSQLAGQNKVEVQSLLFKCVASTLKEFEQTHCKGGKIGFIEFLHTWSTRLLEHYHIHVIIPGGYLLDGVWHDMSRYMFPAKALATMFRKKFCSGLRRLYKSGQLKFYGSLSVLDDPRVWSEFVNRNYNRHWHVHVSVTQGKNPMRLVGYLSNYVYKTAIDHSRIKRIDEKEVVFKYRSHAEGDRGAWNELSLGPEEFLRRFASHIQPKGFTRVRYYGYLGGGVKNERLKQIFNQKGKERIRTNTSIHRSSCEKIMTECGLSAMLKCPKCGHQMLSLWEIRKQESAHDPPQEDPCESIETHSRCA